MWTPTAPVRSALSRTVSSSSPCPRSAQKATTSQRYRSMSQRRITEVSRPPEYARTTRLGVGASGIVESGSQQVEDDRLLRVEAILRLVEHDAGLAIEHTVRDLFAAVRGQAVHHQRPRVGEAEQRLVDLIAAERLQALLALSLLPHAGPDVAIAH